MEEKVSVRNIGLRFDTPDGRLETLPGFELYTNEPNPFSGRTRLPFFMPAAGEVTMRLFDLTGKQIQSQTSFFEQGLNTFFLETEMVGALTVRLDSNYGSASKNILRLP